MPGSTSLATRERSSLPCAPGGSRAPGPLGLRQRENIPEGASSVLDDIRTDTLPEGGGGIGGDGPDPTSRQPNRLRPRSRRPPASCRRRAACCRGAGRGGRRARLRGRRRRGRPVGLGRDRRRGGRRDRAGRGSHAAAEGPPGAALAHRAPADPRGCARRVDGAGLGGRVTGHGRGDPRARCRATSLLGGRERRPAPGGAAAGGPSCDKGAGGATAPPQRPGSGGEGPEEPPVSRRRAETQRRGGGPRNAAWNGRPSPFGTDGRRSDDDAKRELERAAGVNEGGAALRPPRTTPITRPNAGWLFRTGIGAGSVLVHRRGRGCREEGSSR